jgi:hypothetical protein
VKTSRQQDLIDPTELVATSGAHQIVVEAGLVCSLATFRTWAKYGVVPGVLRLSNGWRVYDRASLVEFAQQRRREQDARKARAGWEPGGEIVVGARARAVAEDPTQTSAHRP